MAVHVHHAIANSGGGEEDGGENAMEKMREMFGPGHLDQTVRHAIQACWMALPKERRTAEEVEKEIRRLTERALSNLKQDVAAFGRPKGG
jgi:hypothetical protein